MLLVVWMEMGRRGEEKRAREVYTNEKERQLDTQTDEQLWTQTKSSLLGIDFT